MPITEVGYPYTCCQCCVTIYVIKTALRLCCRSGSPNFSVVSPSQHFPEFPLPPQSTTPNTTAFFYSSKLFPFDAALAVFRKPCRLQQLGIGSNMARNASTARF